MAIGTRWHIDCEKETKVELKIGQQIAIDVTDHSMIAAIRQAAKEGRDLAAEIIRKTKRIEDLANEVEKMSQNRGGECDE